MPTASRLKSSAILALCLAAALAVSLDCATQTAPPPSSEGRATNERDRERPRGGSPEADLASMLGGRFEGVTPGNKLHVNITGVAFHSLSHPYDLFLEVSGQFDDTNIREQGFIHLSNQGRGVYVGYIPHFDPTVSGLSPRAGRFTASEANAACSLYLEPEGDGFLGDTQGTTCALAIRGALGKWSLRVEPGGLVVRSETSGETLRFRRVS